MRLITLFLLLFAALPAVAASNTLGDSITQCWMKTQMSFHEEGFRVDSIDGKAVVVWARNPGTHSHIDVPITKATIAVFHTHHGENNYRPSPEDAQAAKQARIYVYVISEHAVWVVKPDGSEQQFASR